LNFSIIRDMTPVIQTTKSPNVLVVNASFPAKTIPELIAYAKANSGKVNYASPGFGTINNVTTELFKMMAGIDLVQVTYKGSYVPDLLAGQVPVAITPIPTTIEFIRAGKLRALGVTSAKPSDALPGVPTIGQFLPGYEADVWHGIGAPKGTPPDIVAKLNKTINDVLVDPTIKSRLANVGVSPVGGTAEDFGRFVASEVDKWGKVIRTANIKLQ
jgi:tripartite-type tricarboxylate transporter receptor subunit TctC